MKINSGHMKEKELIELGESVYGERKITPSKLGISSRQINYWKENGLIPFSTIDPDDSQKGSEKNKWIRLSIAQAAWACLIQELFDLNVSMKAVHELGRNIWQRSREEKYADKVFRHHIDKNPNRLPKETIERLKNILADERLMENHFRTIINPFTDILKSIFTRDVRPYSLLFVPETGEHQLRGNGNELLIDMASMFYRYNIISIPFLPILSKFMNLDFSNRNFKDLEHLNEVEKQIRDIVVFKRPKVVEIAFQDSDVETIVVTEKHKSREKLAEYILENKIKKGSKLLIDIRSTDNYKITLIQK